MQPYPPPQWYPSQPPTRRASTGWQTALLIVGAALVGLWVVVGTALLQGIAWLGADTAAILGTDVGGVVWVVVALINLVLVAAPAGLIWLLALRVTPRPAAVAETGRAWTLAGLAGGIVGLARSVPMPQNELLLLIVALAAAVCAVGVRALRHTGRAGTTQETPEKGTVLWGATAGLASLAVWLWAGALGGPTETICAALAALAVGWLASSIVDGQFFAAFGRSRVLLVLVGGLATGVALVPLGAAVGGRGVNLVVLTVVPALGIAAAALASAGRTRAGITAMVALAAFGPLAFVDPEETSLLLGLEDVARWAALATLIAVGAGLVISLVYGLALRRAGRTVAAGLTVVAVVAAASVYAFAGRPGLYGERLFVVMAEQADLSGLDAVADRNKRVKDTYDRLVEQAKRTQAPLLAELARWHISATPYYLVNGILVDGGPLVRQWLSARSDVDRVLLDPRLRPLPVSTPTSTGGITNREGGPEWNVTLIGADKAWAAGVRGQGIVVGTSDSGVDGAHPDLASGFRGGTDSWLDPWNGTRIPTDHGGHGTHTMGTVLGRHGIGVAPEAKWIGCVNLDRNAASPSRYLDCLQFMLAPYSPGEDPFTAGRPEEAPHVLTNSWGCPEIEGCDLNSLRPAIEAIHAAGIFFAAAAGNTGPTCGSVADPPAPYRDTFTVGAVDQSGTVSSFSSRGPTPDGVAKPDIMAPGEQVLSSMPGGTYAKLDGTSMATPHIAGVVALMWSANPALIGKIDRTEEILRSTARRVSIPSTDSDCGAVNTTGAGLVDADAAVRAAQRTI